MLTKLMVFTTSVLVGMIIFEFLIGPVLGVASFVGQVYMVAHLMGATK